jgi:hypothetical protein
MLPVTCQAEVYIVVPILTRGWMLNATPWLLYCPFCTRLGGPRGRAVSIVLSGQSYNLLWAAIAQSVYRLATGWTVGGSNSGGGEIFRTRPDQPWDPPNGYRVCLSGVNLPGCADDNPPQSSVEVKERVELYPYSPSGPSRPVLRRTLLLLFFFFTKNWLPATSAVLLHEDLPVFGSHISRLYL